MKMGAGWTGKMLRVNLTARKSSIESTEKYAERFIGGIGIGLKVFWDEVKTDVRAFDPENKLIFAPGPLTGTLAPASGRFEMVSKSPRSYPKETVTRSGMGGFWGPELKYAGYDALILEGKADRWINIWINNGRVEFREAGEYVGKDTYDTQMKIRKDFDPKAKILCIGPAGENLSRLAAILSETSFASGRSGFGAVMGSKNVKSIAVRGTKSLRVFDPEGLVEISKETRRITANNPEQEWTTHVLNSEERKEFINRYREKNVGCFGCPTPCFAYLNIPGSGEAQTHCTNYNYYLPATKYYGPSLERDQAVADYYVLANRLGLDTFEFGRMNKFLEEMFRAGNMKPEPELPLDKFGSREFIQELLKSIAYRRGVGDLLAEGCARAADHLKNGWEFCSKYFPAYGAAKHESVRDYPGVALLWALDSRDPIIDHHPYYYLSVKYQDYPGPFRLSNKDAKAISRKMFGSDLAIDHSTYDYKPEAVVYLQNRSAVINILVVCDWIYPIVQSQTTEDRMGDTSLESRLLRAVTGHDLTERGLDQVGERVWNLARALMVREGRTRADDTLHHSYFGERDGEKAVPKSDFENAKTRYYRLRGWDEGTGRPTREKLECLGLTDVADDLEKENLLE